MKSPIALGAAAPCELLSLFRAGDFFRRRAADDRRGLPGPRIRLAGSAVRRRFRRVLVWRRDAACRGSGLARAAALSALWLQPRSVAAGAVRRRAERQRLRLARQRNAGRAHAGAAPPRAGAGAAARAESRGRRPAPAALAARAAVGALEPQRTSASRAARSAVASARRDPRKIRLDPKFLGKTERCAQPVPQQGRGSSDRRLQRKDRRAPALAAGLQARARRDRAAPAGERDQAISTRSTKDCGPR